VTAAFGQATPGQLGVHQTLDEFADGPAAAIAASNQSLSLRIRLTEAFRHQRADQRRTVCQLLRTLSTAGEITICGTHRQLHWLATTHREDLPGVHNARTTGRDTSPIDDILITATEKLSLTDRRVRILELLANESTETLSYDALASRLTVARQTMRGHVTDLAKLNLVATFGSQANRHVELTAAGSQFVSDEIAVQRRLSDGVLDSPNSSEDSRVARASTGGEDRSGNAASTGTLHRGDHAATVGCAHQHGITLIDHPVTSWNTTEQGWAPGQLSVDNSHEEAVVGVEVASSLQTMVSAALALWDPKARDELWTPDRLTPLDDQLGSTRAVLHYIRTIGWLPDGINTADEFRDEVGEAAVRLRDLTTELGNDDSSDQTELRREIMQLAHGMLGVAAQVADIVDVDLYYQFRVPDWRRNWSAQSHHKRRRELAETIATMTEIQSQYQGHTAYRHLFEDREDKRSQRFSVDVDATDPTGDLLSSIMLVGPGADDFTSELETVLREQQEHEEAPEFAIDVPIVTGTTHAGWCETFRRVAGYKRLTVPDEAVRTARALTGTPFDIAHALTRGLSTEGNSRELRPDELRRGLSLLPEERILPAQRPTVQAIVHTLLRHDEPVPTDILVEAADVTRQSLRNNRAGLVGLRLVEQTETGWRVCLSPSYDEPTEWPRSAGELWSVLDSLYGLAMEVLPAKALSGGHPVTDKLHEPGVPSLSELASSWDLVNRWCPVVKALAEKDLHTSHEGQLGSVEQASVACPSAD
jgi:DNA-binding MarR family transcriptional regulator